MHPSDFSRRLLWHGFAVFVLGLVSGLVMLAPGEPLKNPRLALSSHLVGVTAGMFLLLVGLVWPRMRLTPATATAGFWLVLLGAYGNWAGTFLGAVLGTGALTAIAATGYQAEPWQENLVGALLTTSGIGALGACGVFLWSLRPERPGG
jgi:hydroxylaminobenzene mutase